MTTLHRKIVREALRQWGQVAAVAAVVCVGIATFVTMRSAYTALIDSQADYYARYYFADVFAQVKRAPESLVPRIRLLDGVDTVESRLVYEVTVDVPGLDEPAALRLLSLDREPQLNLLHLRTGRAPGFEERNAVVVSEAFAAANGLEIGASLQAVLNGRWSALHIVGVAISPEYVYELQGAAAFPDNRRFGVAWMSRESMEAAFQMKSAFNDLSLTLARGASEAAVIERVDSLLENYGGLGAYGRSDQISHRFLSDEIKQDRISGTIVPAIFLAIAVFLTHVVLSRLVTRQRDIIATLKAFGYSNTQIALHYILFASIPVGIGLVTGIGLGIWLGNGLAELYARFFRFPVLRFEPAASMLLIAIGISVVTAVGGALAAVRAVVILPPAEAMRPAAPADYRRGILERLGLQGLLSNTFRIIIRNIERRPLRALLTVTGIGLAIAVLLVGRYFYDGIDYIMRVQFELIQRENATVIFHEPRAATVRSDLARLPAVLAVEPFRVVPVRLRAGYRTYRVAIQGVPPANELHQLLDAALNPVPIPEDGLVLTTKLAEILHVVPGDSVRVEVLEGSRPVRDVRIAGLADELIGVSAYMRLAALNGLMRESAIISGAYLAVDPHGASALYRKLKTTPAIATVGIREAMLASFKQTIAESMSVSTGTLSVFAAVIAFSIVYNSVRIALSERVHELASLRVLGFTKLEVTSILLGEHFLLSVVACPVGIWLGHLFCQLIAKGLESELYRMPVILTTGSYGYSLIIVALATVLSAAIVARGVWRLDLIEALKTRE